MEKSNRLPSSLKFLLYVFNTEPVPYLATTPSESALPVAHQTPGLSPGSPQGGNG